MASLIPMSPEQVPIQGYRILAISDGVWGACRNGSLKVMP